MDIDEAKKIAERAWPGEGVTLQKQGQVHKVLAKDGSQLGAGFSWEAALKIATKPLFEAEARRQHEARVNAQTEFMELVLFLKDKYRDEFDAWRKTREVKTGGPEGGKIIL